MEPEPEAGEGCCSAAPLVAGPVDDVVGGESGGGMANEVWRGFLAQSRMGWEVVVRGWVRGLVCDSDGSRAEPRWWWEAGMIGWPVLVRGGAADGGQDLCGVYHHYAFEVVLHNDRLYALLDVTLVFTTF